MTGRQGGKLKPLRQKKKASTEQDSDDEKRIADARENAKKVKAAREAAAAGKGPLKLGSQGLKKSSGKK